MKTSVSSLCTLPKSSHWADSIKSIQAGLGNPRKPTAGTDHNHPGFKLSQTTTQQVSPLWQKKKQTQTQRTSQTQVRTNTILPLTKTSVLQTRWKEDAGAKILKHHVLLRAQRASLAIRRKQKNGRKTKRKQFFFSWKKNVAVGVSVLAAASRKRFFRFVFVEKKKSYRSILSSSCFFFVAAAREVKLKKTRWCCSWRR